MEPQTIDHFVGQSQLVARFRVALEAAWTDAAPLPHMLFVGPPGCGKTLLAHIAARELGVQVHERLAQVLNCGPALHALLLRAEDREIVFLDEVHQLLPEYQVALYRAMEGGGVSVRQRDNATVVLPIKRVTLIAATTDEYRLLRPLRDRFKLVLQFGQYSVDALTAIIAQRVRLMGLACDAGIPEEIAKRAKGTPRLAIRMLEACQRYARSVGATGITRQHFERTVELEGVDTAGLDPDEQRYLRYLGEHRGQPVRLHTLEAALSIHNRTLQTVIEPYLLRAGLIERQASGRVITEAGLRHLGMLGEEAVANRSTNDES